MFDSDLTKEEVSTDITEYKKMTGAEFSASVEENESRGGRYSTSVITVSFRNYKEVSA